MAVTLDAATSGGTYQSQSSISWSHTCSGTNRVLVVGVQTLTGAEPTSVSYGSTGMSQATYRSDGNFGKVLIYYLVNPTVGTNSVTVTFPSARMCCAMASSFNGALNVTYTGTGSNPPSGSTLAIASADATANSRDAGVGFVVCGHTTTPLAVNGTIESLSVYDTLSRGMGYRNEEGGSPSRTVTWSVAGTSWTVVELVIREGDQGVISPSSSLSSSPSPSLSPSSSTSSSVSASRSPSASQSPSASLSPSASQSMSPSASLSPSASSSRSLSPSASRSPSASLSPSPQVSPSASLSPSSSRSPSSSISASPSPADMTLDNKNSNSFSSDSVLGNGTMSNDNKGSNSITLDRPYYL